MNIPLLPNGSLLSPRGSKLAQREAAAAAGVSLCDSLTPRLGRDAISSAGGIVPRPAFRREGLRITLRPLAMEDFSHLSCGSFPSTSTNGSFPNVSVMGAFPML